MTTTDSASPSVSRRAVLAGAAAVGAVTALAACGSAGGSSSAAPPGPVTVKESDVPVGGGKILADAGVVVTQPAAGTYKAFSAICTHQGCTVAAVQNGTIVCACHNSMFSATDGSVKQGPATSPLGAKTVKADGGTLTIT
jgi:Rieske Fe-S protein